MIPNAIDADMVENLSASMDRIDECIRAKGWDDYRNRPIAAYNNLIYPNFIADSRNFLDLIDHPTVFPKVFGLLGWNIYCYYSDLVVTPCRKADDREPGQIVTPDWHRDSGRVNHEIGANVQLSVKIAYMISDQSKIDRGNMCIMPGSHRIDGAYSSVPSGNAWKHGLNEMVVLTGKPGDAVIFDRRLWHTRSENDSPDHVKRKMLFYGYSYRWMRGYTYDKISELPKAHVNEVFNDPIRQQLLGMTITPDNVYYPTDQDVPLKGWIEDNCYPQLEVTL